MRLCVYIVQPPAENVDEPEQRVNTTSEDTPPPTSDPTPPPTPQSQSPVPVSAPGPIVSQPEEPGTGRAQGEQGKEGSEWKVAAPLKEEAAAVVHVPLAVVKLESMLDPTELSTVSAERHGPGSGLPPKQSQSQKQDYAPLRQ